MDNLKKEEQMLCEIINNLVEGKKCMENIENISEIDWEYFYFICEKNRVQFYVLNKMEEYLPLFIKERLWKEQHQFNEKVNMYMEELRYVTSLSEEMNIPILCIKGLPLAHQLYDDIYIRPFNDLDVIVSQKYILKFRNKLLEDHLQMNKGVYSKKEYLDFVGIFHEFWLKKDINEEQSVFVEIKETSSALERRFVNDFMENSILVQIHGVEVRTTDLVHTFLHLCSNTYENYETMNGVLRHIRMRDLLDVKIFLNNNINDFDWNEIVKLSHKYEITHRIYCVLKHVNNLFREKIPENIIELFSINSLKYNLSYCNSIGGKIEWKNSVIERMFMSHEKKKEIYLKEVYERETAQIRNKKYIMHCEKDIGKEESWSMLEVPGMPSQAVKWRIVKVDNKLAVDLLLNKILISEKQFFYQMIFFISGEIKTIWIRNTENGYKYGYRNDTDDRVIDYSKDSELFILQNNQVVRSYLDETQSDFYKSRNKGIGCNVLIHIQQGECSLPIIAKYSDRSNPEEYLDNIEIWIEENAKE